MLCDLCGLKNATCMMVIQNKQNWLCGSCYNQQKQKREEDEAIKNIASDIDKSLVCNNCGISLEDVKLSGLFGCEQCYNNFKDYVLKTNPKLKKFAYAGQTPELFKQKQKIQDYNIMIESALKRGDYDLAAKLGKKISDIRESYGAKL